VSGYQAWLAHGRQIGFDRLLIATGTRARPWPNNAEADLDEVFTPRIHDDAERLRARIRVLPSAPNKCRDLQQKRRMYESPRLFSRGLWQQ
jgi:NADPH-dependent 2,4-dienoyl-CoA reductase/sulfur reductase-like enzyme